jgi:hypothetical protein
MSWTERRPAASVIFVHAVLVVATRSAHTPIAVLPAPLSLPHGSLALAIALSITVLCAGLVIGSAQAARPKLGLRLDGFVGGAVLATVAVHVGPHSSGRG